MHQQPQSEPQNLMDQTRHMARWLTLAIESVAVTVEVFLHRRMGENAIGVPGGIAILVILCYCLAWPQHDLSPMVYFLLAYLAACGWQRIAALRRRVQGDQGHSRYMGDSRLQPLFPRFSAQTVKGYVEPAFTFLVGLSVCSFSEPLGCYLMIASACLMGCMAMSVAYHRNRAVAMNDAVIEQQHVASLFREMNNGRH